MSFEHDLSRPHVLVDVIDADGAVLDWLVAQVVDAPVKIGWSKQRRAVLLNAGAALSLYQPLADSELVNRLRESHNIVCRPEAEGFSAVIQRGERAPVRASGPTAAHAVLRCAVASQNGPKALVPAVLTVADSEQYLQPEVAH